MITRGVVPAPSLTCKWTHLLHTLVVLIFGCCHSCQVIGLCCSLVRQTDILQTVNNKKTISKLSLSIVDCQNKELILTGTMCILFMYHEHSFWLWQIFSLVNLDVSLVTKKITISEMTNWWQLMRTNRFHSHTQMEKTLPWRTQAGPCRWPCFHLFLSQPVCPGAAV